MTAEEFVDLLDERGVLPPVDILGLREQLAATDKTWLPIFLARRLVEGGYLNSYLAKTLLEEGARKYRRPEDGLDDLESPEFEFRDEPERAQLLRNESQAGVPAEPVAVDLPPLDAHDLLFGERIEQATLLPSAQPQKGIALPWKSKRPLRLDKPPHPQATGWWIASGVLVALVLALLIYLLLL